MLRNRCGIAAQLICRKSMKLTHVMVVSSMYSVSNVIRHIDGRLLTDERTTIKLYTSASNNIPRMIKKRIVQKFQ
jgi:hypothetical protein